jgi:hypothetical protein
MNGSDSIASAVRNVELEIRKRIIEDHNCCPSCGAKMIDVTDAFFAGTIDPVKMTTFHVITTATNKSVGACKRNCHYKGYIKN